MLRARTSSDARTRAGPPDGRKAAAGLLGEPSARTVRLLARLDREIARQPDDPELQVMKGRALERSLESGRALACYDRALASVPRDLPALLAKASLLERTGRGRQAVAVLDLAIAAVGDEAELCFEQGRILHELRRPRRAIRYYLRCLGLKPHHKKAITNLAAALIGLGRHREAEALCSRELKRAPRRLELLCSRGIARMELGEYAESMKDYRAALRLSPADQTVLYNLACWQMKRGSRGKALACLARAVKGSERFAREAQTDPTLQPLQGTLRFWRIILSGAFLDDASYWHLCKRFKVKRI